MSKIKRIGLFAVGDDAWQGGIQYINNIMNALNALGQQGLEIFLFRHSGQNFPDLHQFENITIHQLDTEKIFPAFSFTNRLNWFMQRKMKGRINPRIENIVLDKKLDFVFPITLADCNGQINAGSWIADFQYYHFPNGASPKIVADAERTISNIANNTRKIILSSNYCEQDCHQLFPSSKGKTHVMPFAVYIDKKIFDFTDFKKLTDQYQLPEKFLMVANLFAPTKNHKTLFEALGILRQKGLNIPLVCTGNIVDYRNQGFANDILAMLTANKIRSLVHFLGLIPRFDQLTLYRMSVALVQPSVNEGWSTSVEEAKALGKNLLVSDIDVHKEQNEGNAIIFESLNPNDLAEKIEQTWNRSQHKTFPEREAEQKAYQQYQENVRKFGSRFLEIAAKQA